MTRLLTNIVLVVVGVGGGGSLILIEKIIDKNNQIKNP